MQTTAACNKKTMRCMRHQCGIDGVSSCPASRVAIIAITFWRPTSNCSALLQLFFGEAFGLTRIKKATPTRFGQEIKNHQ